MQKYASSFDFILNTIATKHDINPYIQLLKRDATLVLVGALEPLEPLDNSQVAFASSPCGRVADRRHC